MGRKSDRDEPGFRKRNIFVAGSYKADDEDTEDVLATVASGRSADHDVEDSSVPIGTDPEVSVALPSTDDEPLKPGFTLSDRYEIVGLIHTGGMGRVYKAIDRRRHLQGLDQIYVAIKMTRRSVIPEPEAFLFLEREAARAQRLSHPNIVNIYDFDSHDGQFYLIMEWLQGKSVKELLRRAGGQRLAPEFAWQIIQGVARALQHAHSSNIVHADINLSNIFITETQQIKLLDFGVSSYGNDPEETVDREYLWATRKYASPDVLSGAPPAFEDDIFSLACVAYRLLGGKHAFHDMDSIGAEKAGATPQPIPGLSEAQWDALSRALSFTRANRPSTVSIFLGDLTERSGSPGKVGTSERRTGYWRVILPAAAVLLAAGVWWLARPGFEDRAGTISEPSPVAEEPGADAAASGPSELEQLLTGAAQAMDEERYIAPEGDNARALYQDVLALEPANAAASTGLRAISDVFVQRANTALRDEAPEQAIAALSVASETDPDNPAIGMVDDLLVAEGNARLAGARLAAAEGDADRAAALLSEAERYGRVDPNEINAVRSRIARSAEERRFLRRLTSVDDHITAGRLIAPEGNNAHGLLLELREAFGNDSRLRAATERLGERLLARAGFAAAAGRIAEASGYLEAAAALGVMTAEIAAARTSLLTEAAGATGDVSPGVESRAAKSDEPSPVSGGESEYIPAPGNIAGGPAAAQAANVGASATSRVSEAAEPSGPEPLAQTAPAGPGSGTASPVRDGAAGRTSLQASAPGLPPAAAGSEPPEPRLSNLSDLNIERYVAPTFPRRARRLRLSGSVELRFSILTDGTTGAIEIVDAEPGDVFVASAERAVQQWRFAPREREHKAHIRMRFE